MECVCSNKIIVVVYCGISLTGCLYAVDHVCFALIYRGGLDLGLCIPTCAVYTIQDSHHVRVQELSVKV